MICSKTLFTSSWCLFQPERKTSKKTNGSGTTPLVLQWHQGHGTRSPGTIVKPLKYVKITSPGRPAVCYRCCLVCSYLLVDVSQLRLSTGAALHSGAFIVDEEECPTVVPQTCRGVHLPKQETTPKGPTGIWSVWSETLPFTDLNITMVYGIYLVFA